MEKYEKTLIELRKSGWFEGRKIDISKQVSFLESKGFKVFKKAEEFMEEFGELKIVLEKLLSNNQKIITKHSTVIEDVIGIGDSSWFGLEEYLDEDVIPVAELFGGEFTLYISKSGRFYENMGWIGDNALEAFDNLIDKKKIIMWHEYNDKN